VNIIPAIDILAGHCVRLTRGNYDQVRRYSGDPVAVAGRFERAGARWIHIVDLDAARGSGSTDTAATGSQAGVNNRTVIQRIARSVSCSLEVGGGIRRREDVEELIAAGAGRLVLGTVVIERPEEVELWCRDHPGVLWAGIDAEDGKVRISGWQREAPLGDVELARRVTEMGLCGIVYTSIRRDGTLEGPDIEATNRIAEVSRLPVILSGGIGSVGDVQRVLDQRHPGIQGLIVGKALYENRVRLKELLRISEAQA
jgi:phosphoribosylformimino-5-aminoimidazole carboxamide ribotide isomerase